MKNRMRDLACKVIKYTCKNTEELGILVEKAMCDMMDVTFKTKRNYDSLPKDVYDDINSTVGPSLKRMKMNHTGNMNMKYDFMDDYGKTMSVKTIMSGNKICPQSIGQCSFRSFNSKTGLDLENKDDFKRYFMCNKNEMLKQYLYHCICCDNTIVYKFHNGLIYTIDKCGEVEFVPDLHFDTSKTIEDWNESNTVYVNCGDKRLSLGEIQIHNNRDCIKFRFNIDSLVDMIRNNYIKNVNVNVYSLKAKYYFKVDTKEKDLMPRNKLCFPSFNYIGSKMKLLGYIRETVKSYTGKDYDEIDGFADICSGTGVVAFDVLKGNCKKILTNDIQHYAYTVSSVWSTKNIDIEKINEMIVRINDMIENVNLPKYDKTSPYFIYNNYTEAGPDGRMYLSMKNGYKIDIVRHEIMRLQKESLVNLNEHNLLLKLLLYAVAGVSNIASVYGAYLKKYKACALKDLVLDAGLIDILKAERELGEDGLNHISKNMNITDLLSLDDLSGYEVVYIDPPYVANRGYHDNYHLLETISKYDNPSIKGKTGLRETGVKSKFCSKRDAASEFRNVLEKIKSKYIFISYSSESVVSKDDMISMMVDAGWKDVICCEKEYQRFKSNKNSEDLQQKNIIEYIFCGKRF